MGKGKCLCFCTERIEAQVPHNASCFMYLDLTEISVSETHKWLEHPRCQSWGWPEMALLRVVEVSWAHLVGMQRGLGCAAASLGSQECSSIMHHHYTFTVAFSLRSLNLILVFFVGVFFFFLGFFIYFFFLSIFNVVSMKSAGSCLLACIGTFLMTVIWALRKPEAEPKPSEHQSLFHGTILCPSYVLSENIVYDGPLCNCSYVFRMFVFWFWFWFCLSFFVL